MSLITIVLSVHLVVGLSAWRITGNRQPLYLGLTALPLWVWAYEVIQ